MFLAGKACEHRTRKHKGFGIDLKLYKISKRAHSASYTLPNELPR